MNLADEQDLRRRLHAEVDRAEVGPAPAEAVFLRYRAARARRLSALAAAAAVVLAATVTVLAVRAPGRPAGRPPGLTRPPGSQIFAAGTAPGGKWSLAAVNLADPGYRCLPGVVLDGQNGDLLQPGFVPGMALGNAAFLAVSPGRPAAGFAFIWPRPGVTGMTASFGDGTSAALRPVTVSVCGQRFRLAGFRWPRQGVTGITARSAQGQRISYTPPAGIFRPDSSFQAGVWVNVQGAAANAAAGVVGSGRIGGTPWRMDVTLGPEGECFTAHIGPSGTGDSASICGTVSTAPRGAALTSVPYARQAGTLVWFMGTVSARTATVRARLSDGRIVRLVPTVAGGRKYIAVGARDGVRMTRLTLYGAAGQVLASLTDLPRGK